MVTNSEDDTTDTTNRLDGRINLLYRKHRLTLYGAVTKSDLTTPAFTETKSKIISYALFYNTSIWRNTAVFVSFTHDKDILNDRKDTRFDAQFQWFYGKVMFAASYEFRNRIVPEEATKDHRVYLRLSRHFRKIIR